MGQKRDAVAHARHIGGRQSLSGEVGQDLACRESAHCGKLLCRLKNVFIEIESRSHRCIIEHHASDVNREARLVARGVSLSAMRAAVFLVAVFGLACATTRPTPIAVPRMAPEVLAARLAEADRLASRGCYLCLKEAAAAYASLLADSDDTSLSERPSRTT